MTPDPVFAPLVGFAPLPAAIELETILKFAGPLIFFGIYAINQLVQKASAERQRQQQQRMLEAARQRTEPNSNDDIQAQRRRAAEREAAERRRLEQQRAEAVRRQEQQRRAEAQRAEAQRRGAQGGRAGGQPQRGRPGQRPPAPRYVEAELVPAVAVANTVAASTSRLAAEASRYVSTDDVTSGRAPLGTVARGHDDKQAELLRKAEGQRAADEAASAAAGTTPLTAEGIARAMRDPAQVRLALIASEVLRRPSW
jgi:hypothetical protein